MMTKREFQTLAMLYAANIDCNIHEYEVEQLLMKSDPVTYERMKKAFQKKCDMEMLSLIQEYKNTFIVDEKAKQDFIDDIHTILLADGRFLPIESHLLRTLRRILE